MSIPSTARATACDEERVPPDEYRLIAVLGRLAVLDDIAERHWELLQAKCAQSPMHRLKNNSINETEKPSELKDDNSNDDHGLVDLNERPNAEWLRVPIRGTGTRNDMYRPDLPAAVTSRVAAIEAGPDGKPLHADCFVWVPDRIDLSKIKLSPRSVRLPKDEALKQIQARNPKINPTHMERLR